MNICLAKLKSYLWIKQAFRKEKIHYCSNYTNAQNTDYQLFKRQFSRLIFLLYSHLFEGAKPLYQGNLPE